MTARIRSAGPGDAPALGAILSDWIDETHWMPRLHTRTQDSRFVAHLIDHGTVYVAELSGATVGFLCCEDQEVTALYLSKEARGQGAGTALLQRVKDTQTRLSLWTFQANTGALRFYARHGFQETDRSDGVNAEGLPDVQLTWEHS